jgi:hypothetical protein
MFEISLVYPLTYVLPFLLNKKQKQKAKQQPQVALMTKKMGMTNEP